MRQAFAAALASIVRCASGQTLTDGAQAPAAEAPAPTAAGEVPVAGATDDFTAQDTCGASAYQRFIGSPISSMTPPANARVIRPGDPVTMDFRSERLNINLDANGVITSLECH
jgi:hypothetical protein